MTSAISFCQPNVFCTWNHYLTYAKHFCEVSCQYLELLPNTCTFMWPTLGQNPGNGKMRKKQNGSKNIALHPLGIGGVRACQK